MSNNPFYKAAFFIVLSCAAFIAHAEVYYKEVRKTVKVNNNARLDMDISYADVTVTTWDQGQIEIVVKQNVNTKTEDRANEIFESITVNIRESADLVGLDVSLGNYSCNGKSESYTITVEIKMPATGIMDGDVSFGNLNISDLKGACEMKVEYGSFKANTLASTENDIYIAFGDASIQSTNGGEFKNEYGQLKIKKLNGNAEITSSFGDLEIDHVSKDVKHLEIDVDYGDADIDLSPDASFTFDAASSYGEIELPSNAKITHNESDYTSKRTTGTIGSGGSNKLEIKCDFGDVEVDIDVN